MSSLREVAKEAGVSVSIASRALNGDPNARISDATKARVIAAAARLEYVPNERSRALRFSRSGAIALIVPDVTNAVFGDLAGGIRQVANSQGISVLLGQLTDGSDPRALADMIGEGRTDGVVLQRAEGIDDAQLAALTRVRQPLVLFNSTLPGRPGSVALDDEGAVAIAVDHLGGMGHRRIGFIGGSPSHDAARRRLAGYRTAVASRGWDELAIDAGWEAPAGAAAIGELLALADPPTAVIVASINAAVGAAGAALRAGVRIPEDLSVVSIQDNWIASAFFPALTAVRMPLAQAGATAARMVLSMVDGGAPSDVVITDPGPELIERASTAPPAQRSAPASTGR